MNNDMTAKQDQIHPDPNLNVKAGINRPDVRLYDVRQAPFQLYGFHTPFVRMPEEVARATSEGVLSLHRDAAGGRVRFSCDSKYVAIRAEFSDITRFSHMPLTGTAGFDLYIDDPVSGVSRYYKTFVPPYGMVDGYEQVIDFPDRRLRYFTIHFPSYSKVNRLFVGLQESAVVGEGLPYRDPLPIVYYGSSITQGACSSRPGVIYQNMVSRDLNLDYRNFGFSGHGRGEDAMIEYLASLPMLAFVSDYDHNADDPAHLRATHRKLYSAIRAKHPDIPYIMLSRPDFDNNEPESLLRRDVIVDTDRFARANGDRNVYFIDGASIYRGEYEWECTVDNVHPNDLGGARIASAITATLRRAFTQRACTI